MSKFAQAALLAVASASVAACSDSSRFGEGPGYAPATANQQAVLGNPQYASQPGYRPETTASIQPGYAPQRQAEPWYGRPWQSPQAAPPAYQPQPYPQQTYQQPQYQPQPSYQTQPAATVYPEPLRPLAVEKPRVPTQQMVLQPGPRSASAPTVTQPMPAPLAQAPAPLPRRTTAPVSTGSTLIQPAPAAVPQPMPTPARTAHPPSVIVAPAPVAQAPAAQAPRADQRQLASNWSATGGSFVTMKPGDSVSTLSQRYGVPVAAIMSANNFADATRVQPGQQVLIPTYIYGSAAKPAEPRPAVQPMPMTSAAVSGGEHVVRHGETLESIAKMYGIARGKMETANHLRADAVLRPGQKLVIPHVAGRNIAEAAPAPASAEAMTRPTPVAAATPVADPHAAAKPPEQKTASVAPDNHSIIAVAQEPKPTLENPRGEAKPPSFRWPVRGRVIEAFGSTTGSTRNDGINLAVPEGTSVKSAEDGEVIYSGNELKGYGNVVLVKHADGWVTVYAHASDLLVNKGDKVTRGQIIARAGATGSVTQPQLHFELRKGQKPVDPKTYLTN